ncbi:hypothetical protein WDU94_005229 [Cyamophila willieti]
MIDDQLVRMFADKKFQIFTSMNYLERSRYYQDGLLLDVTCPGMKHFLNECSNKHLFTTNNFFILINSTAIKLNSQSLRNQTSLFQEDEEVKVQFSRYLNKVQCLLDCRLFYSDIYYPRSKFIHFKFFEMYRVKKHLELYTHLILFGTNIYQHWLPPCRRHFHGTRLKTATVVSLVSRSD